MHRSARSSSLLVAAVTSSCFFVLVMITRAQQQHQRAAHHKTEVTCIPHERDALLAFKTVITSDPSMALASWQQDGQDCCQWNGVLCSNHSGHILKLQLHDYFLAGQISPSFLSLEYLEHLDLSRNNLQGSDGHIPEFLGSLRNLKYLNLSNMPFCGEVPSYLGNLSNLQYLDLSSTGDTHSTDVSWLRHLHFLRYLNLGGVNLGATNDWPQALNMIPSLRVLHLSKCSLTSSNQSLLHLNLTNLEKLDLSNNYVNHPIASCWFWNITHLKHLILRSTGLYGPIPPALERMTYLQVLDISQPFGSKAKLGIITASFRNLCNLETLHIRNYLLHIDIRELLESLPQCSSNRFLNLVLEQNNISGVLPINWMWPITSLVSLDLYGNNIGGVLPNWMGQLNDLDFLDLGCNNISGVLPKWIGKLTSLEFLDLSCNNIIGVLPNWIGQLIRLEHLNLAENNISGILPNSIGKLTNLGYLDLSTNNITGPLPSFIGYFTALCFLELSHNHLTGHIPYEIGMLSSLQLLGLNNNDLNGTIIEKHFTNMKSLLVIDLSHNSLTIEISLEWNPPFRLAEAYFTSCRMGPLFPSWLKWMVDISDLDISNTGITDRLPDWFCSTFSNGKNISMSNNQICGGLPANMENMSLVQLYLGSNQLTGPIPPMPISLNTLDLSRNFLSGPLL